MNRMETRMDGQMDGLNGHRHTYQVQKTVHLDFVWHIALLFRCHQNAIRRRLATTVERMLATLQNKLTFRIRVQCDSIGIKQWQN